MPRSLRATTVVTLALSCIAGCALPAYPGPFPASVRRDPRLSAEIAAATKGFNYPDSYVVGSAVTQDWQPIRNEATGALVEKRMTALVVLRTSHDSDPQTCRVWEIRYSKDVAGGALSVVGPSMNGPWALPCAAAPR